MQRLEAAATIESTISNAPHALAQYNFFYGWHSAKPITHICAINRYSLKAAATRESLVSNARHTLGDGDGGEAAAIKKSIVLNRSHWIRNSKLSYKFSIYV